MQKAKAAKATAKVDKGRSIQLGCREGETADQAVARMLVRGTVATASTVVEFSRSQYSDLSLTDLARALKEQGEAVNRGDFASLERMLNAQAVALNAMFAELARRAALNMGTHLDTTETYLRLALKAQSQSRATVETLATVKNPPVLFARQANINNGGQQQVNNGTAPTRTLTGAGAGETENSPSKLLEAHDGERLDFGTQGTAIKAGQDVAALGALNGTEDSER